MHPPSCHHSWGHSECAHGVGFHFSGGPFPESQEEHTGSWAADRGESQALPGVSQCSLGTIGGGEVQEHEFGGKPSAWEKGPGAS